MFARRHKDLSNTVMLGPMACAAQLGSASISPNKPKISTDRWTLKQVQGDGKHLQQDPSFAVATGSLITVRDMRQSFGNQIS